MDLTALVVTFGTIFVVELPDKTFLATLVLATKYRAILVWLGVSAAFTVQTLVAVLLGHAASFLPEDIVHVAGRMTLADGRGPFGNPTSDSARSMVTPSTVRALCTVFAPHELPAGRIDGILATTARRFLEFTGARETSRAVI